jgi:hypothetical protein
MNQAQIELGEEEYEADYPLQHANKVRVAHNVSLYKNSCNRKSYRQQVFSFEHSLLLKCCGCPKIIPQ